MGKRFFQKRNNIIFSLLIKKQLSSRFLLFLFGFCFFGKLGKIKDMPSRRISISVFLLEKHKRIQLGKE